MRPLGLLFEQRNLRNNEFMPASQFAGHGFREGEPWPELSEEGRNGAWVGFRLSRDGSC